VGNARRIGIVGLGSISGAYLDTLAGNPAVTITAVADLDESRAETVASELPQARAMSVSELVASDTVDTVLNLTIPAAHAEIALAAIEQGKHVYGEKPFAVTMDEGRAILAAAREAGVVVGSAPDTVLGTGIQTARNAIDRGAIGRPLSAVATMVTPGHEYWHPNPDFYYVAGGGPVLDMGPYYVASLLHLMGPVRSVIASGSRLRHERTIATGRRAGETIPVEVLTHVSGVLEHAGGALSTITMSFDARSTRAVPIEVHGELGTLSVPDPNQFSGPVAATTGADESWSPLRPEAGYIDGARGIGLMEFVDAIEHGRMPRANGDFALHTLDVMLAMLEAAGSDRRVPLTTTTSRPPIVPLR
jgi:predicted dehydrogenase